MFAVNLRTKVVISALLPSVILLNSLGVSAMAVQAKQEEVSSISLNSQDTEQESRAVSTDAHPSNDTENAVERQQTAKSDFGTSAAFVENVGQFDPRARFQAQANGANMYFSEDTIWFTLLEPPAKDPNENHHNATMDELIEENQEPRKGVNLKVNLIGSNSHPTIESFNRVVTSFSYFTGSDPSDWQSDVPVWGGIRYVDIYPGMDLEITSEQNRLLWQFLVTDASRFYDKNNQVAQQGIRIKLAGHQRLQNRNNTLDIATDVGTLSLPIIRVNDAELLPEVDKNGELIIPVPAQTSISLGTFRTVSYTIPTGTELNLPSSWQPALSTQTANTASTYQQSSDDVLIYSAYFGTKYTLGDSIAVDSDGAVYVAGSVGWDDFPQGAGVFYLPGASATSYESFVAKLDLDTNQLIYTAFFKTRPAPECDNTGGVGGIAVDNNKNVYVVGTTGNPDFPTTEGVIDRQLTDECPGNPHYGYEERADGFILKINAAGNQLLYSTYLGGSEFDVAGGVFVSEDGSAYVGGRTYSADIPKGTQGYSHTLSGQNDVFITKLSPAADQQEFFTYVGGSNLESTFGNLKVSNDGSVYLAGITTSSDFPALTDAYIASYSNSSSCNSSSCYNAFALKLDSRGNTLMYATYLGEVGSGYATDLDIDATGHAYISGWVRGGADFPHTHLIGPGSSSTGMDGFAVKLATDGKSAVYSTLIGGQGSDTLWAISVDDTGNAYLVGDSSSADFPIPPGALDTSFEEFGADLIVVRLDPSGSQLTYATFLGGSGWDYMTWHGAPLDSNGNINILVRNTESTDFPTNHWPVGNGIAGSDAFIWYTAAVVRLSTNIPVIPYDCSWMLSPIGKAVFNQVVPADKQETGEVCGNLYNNDSLITLPPGQAAFDRFRTLARDAQNEIDFTTMIWEPAKDDNPTNINDSPGESFLRGVKELYDKVKDPVGKGLPADYYAGGVRVRILSGFVTEEQRMTILNDLDRLGIDRVNPALDWTVEVASFRDEWGQKQSHVKMMIVDGEHVIVAGYNMQYVYLEDIPEHDMGVEIRGPIAQRAIQVFDGLWLGAKSCHLHTTDNLNCNPVSTIESPILHDEDVLNPVVAGNDAVFSLFRDDTDKTADNGIVAAINAANSEVNILQNRFYNPPVMQPYIRAVLDALQKGDGQVQVNILVSGDWKSIVENQVGICGMVDQLEDELENQPDSSLTYSLEAQKSSNKNPIHTKALSVDGTFVIVGSQNWDTSAWGDNALSFGDLAEYSLGVDGTTAASDFNTKFWDEWDAANLVKCLSADTTASSLQAAIDQAEPGTAIFIPSGNYTGAITINKPIVLVGTGANETIFQPQGNEPAFRVTSSDVMIANLKITGGAGYGVELIDSSPNSLKDIIINKIVFEGNVLGGVLAQGLIPGSPMNYSIESNTFIGGASGVTINMVETQTISSAIRDNIFSGQSNAPMHIVSTDDSNVEYSYNLFDDCGLGNCVTNWVQGSISAVSSEHDNLFDLDPLFANPASSDYQLSAGSPAIDAGDASLQDGPYLDGNNDDIIRIDIGAFEYMPGPNVAPVVNAGSDQTVDLGNSVTVNATYSDSDNTENHSARIDWGDGIIEDVPVNMTGLGAGEIIAEHTYADSGNYTVEVCATELYGSVGCDTVNIVLNSGFPSTAVLDNFNRANGSIGNNWSGYASKYHVTSNQMTVDYNGSNSDIYWSNSFGVDQEVYVTFTDIDASASEHDLLLKAQNTTTWGDGVIEVLYDPTGQTVQVWTYEWPDGWVQYGADIPVTFVDGDTFGARALANGTVEVYKNGTLLATRDITSWSHYAAGGYIGLWFIGAEDAVLDDFGGGTISGGMQSMMAGYESGIAASPDTESDSWNVEINSAGQFWQGIPMGTNQKASVTFATVPVNLQGVLLKPQSNGMWGEDVVEVFYDVASQRIQVWMYNAQTGNGWMQYGKDIPVKIVSGDTFSVRVLADGTVEIYRNEKLLAKRDVTP